MMTELSLADPTLSSTQRAYRRLRQMILTGVVAPGERLKIDGLKQTLGTGASPVREALSLLTSDQLVDRIDQRGFRAAIVSEAQFHEILGLRCKLEDMALRESVARADQGWEESVVLALHRLGRADRSDVETFETLHKAFHMALLSGCDSPILLRFCDQLYDLNIRYRYLAGRSISYGQRDVGREHAAILDAAIAGDGDGASAALLAHYRNTGQFLAEALPGLTGAGA